MSPADGMMWRAGGRCPSDGCNFQFFLASDDELELDVVAVALMQSHAKHSHPDVDSISLYGYRKQEGSIFEPVVNEAPDPEPEERSRLVN